MIFSESTLATKLPILLIGVLAACGAPEIDAQTHAAQVKPQVEQHGLEPKQSQKEQQVHIIHTGDKIFSLAAIPATAHLAKSHIVTAHGKNGVAIRDTSGTVLWTIDTPARLVAHYQNLLVVFSQNDEGITTLKRYRLPPSSSPVLVDTASPSPIAATTLQRTAIASLGPAQISGENLIIGDDTISAPGPISAIAAAAYFPPLVSRQTLLIATENGDIIIQPN